jgi:type II secretory pathway component GspD/PulD (secretin)
MSTRTMLITLLASALTLPALAQEATPTPAEQPAATVQGSEPTGGSVSRDRDTLSVDFPDEDIKTILRNVADLFELNLVVPDTLTGKTSIKLRDVTWRQIFQVVLTPVGYTYIEEGNIIKIVSNDTLQQEPAATEVFIINNAKAEDLRPTIAGLVDAAAGGKIEINARSNALIITERPSRMGRIRAIIDQLDKATAQVMIESQFVEVTDRDVRNIGVNWASLQGVTLGARTMSHEFQRERGQTFSNGGTASASNGSNSTSGTNRSTSTGSTGSTTNNTTTGTNTSNTVNGNNVAGTTTGTTSTTTGTTLTPVTTTSTVGGVTTSVTTNTVVPSGSSSTSTTTTDPTSTSSTVTSNGTTGSTSNGVTSGTTSSITDALTNAITNTAANAFTDLMSLTNTGGTNRLTSAVFSASDFNVIVSALKTQNNTKVVSNPTVVTLNNTEAELNIGSEFPIPSYTYNSERGTFEVSGFQYKPIGIILKVTPQVNGQGVIRLNLTPEVSQQNGETTFGGAGGATIPIIATRKVKTQISLKDGYTAGIGGLVTSNKNHGGTKVPILGDIPGLGRLFSSKSVNDQTTNLLIFITAKTVNADGAAPSDVFTSQALESVGMNGGK